MGRNSPLQKSTNPSFMGVHSWLKLQRPVVNLVVRRGDEALEERMGLVRLALEFGMKLAGNEEGVVLQLDDLDELAVGRQAAEDEAGLLEALLVGVIEFVTVPVAFVDHECAVEMRRHGIHGELAGLGAEAHGAALLRNFLLLVQQ